MSLEHEIDAERQVDSHENTVTQPQKKCIQKCEQCIHWNVEQGHHETECYNCKRFHVDMFTPRAGA
jgi:hypothetical protein